MHAEGFAAGELKHGPIALIDKGTPVICVVPSPVGRGVLHDKVVSNIQEVRARGARTIVIAEEGDEAVVRVRRPPDLRAAYADPAGAAGDHRAVAGARLRDRRRPGPRRGPAPQPGQVGHRRVATAHVRNPGRRTARWPGFRRHRAAQHDPGHPVQRRVARVPVAGVPAAAAGEHPPAETRVGRVVPEPQLVPGPARPAQHGGRAEPRRTGPVGPAPPVTGPPGSRRRARCSPRPPRAARPARRRATRRHRGSRRRPARRRPARAPGRPRPPPATRSCARARSAGPAARRGWPAAPPGSGAAPGRRPGPDPPRPPRSGSPERRSPTRAPPRCAHPGRARRTAPAPGPPCPARRGRRPGRRSSPARRSAPGRRGPGRRAPPPPGPRRPGPTRAGTPAAPRRPSAARPARPGRPAVRPPRAAGSPRAARGGTRDSSRRRSASSSARQASSRNRLAWSRAAAGSPSNRPTRAGSRPISHRRCAGVNPAHQALTSAGAAPGAGRPGGGGDAQPVPAALARSSSRSAASRSAAAAPSSAARRAAATPAAADRRPARWAGTGRDRPAPRPSGPRAGRPHRPGRPPAASRAFATASRTGRTRPAPGRPRSARERSRPARRAGRRAECPPPVAAAPDQPPRNRPVGQCVSSPTAPVESARPTPPTPPRRPATRRDRQPTAVGNRRCSPGQGGEPAGGPVVHRLVRLGRRPDPAGGRRDPGAQPAEPGVPGRLQPGQRRAGSPLGRRHHQPGQPREARRQPVRLVVEQDGDRRATPPARTANGSSVMTTPPWTIGIDALTLGTSGGPRGALWTADVEAYPGVSTGVAQREPDG